MVSKHTTPMLGAALTPLFGLCFSINVALEHTSGEDNLREEAITALVRATSYFSTEVAAHGGYVYRYSEDLQKREGEGRADKDTVWLQPPGTPAVGLAYVEAFEATGNQLFLDAARAAAICLVQGQLHSGGWADSIVFDEARRREYAYRVDNATIAGRNTTTLDDNKTQSALRLLMRVDQSLQFQDETIHEAVSYGLDAILRAQYPNGAWSQRFDGPSVAPQPPSLKASFPETWSRTFPRQRYTDYYTFNDNCIVDTVDMLLLAHDIYDDRKYLEAVLKAGDFVLLAQMPEPQPAWAQQYNHDMQPAWARRFEPPAITGGESQRVIQLLLRLYDETGATKFLEPVPRAIAYLKRSILPDGHLARFYELQTNRPLYLTQGDYRLTYSAENLPTHYSFVVGSSLDRLQERYQHMQERVGRSKREEAQSTAARRRVVTTGMVARVRKVVDDLDDQGRWVQDGRLRTFGDSGTTQRVLESRTFIRNLNLLTEYVAATR